MTALCVSDKILCFAPGSNKEAIKMNQTTHKSCPIVWDDLFNRIGDEEIIVLFAESFVKNGEKIMTSLKDAVASGDPEEIELYGHALKGSASNIGAIPLAKLAWQLENSAAQKNTESADEWMTQIAAEYNALMALLKSPDWVGQAKKE
jgi:HPt (histidine-containing phosphotransfer) domain-containing protein